MIKASCRELTGKENLREELKSKQYQKGVGTQRLLSNQPKY